VYRLPREVFQKRYCHCTSTKLQLRVIRWVHILCRLPL